VLSLISESAWLFGSLLSHYFVVHDKSGLEKAEIIHSSTAFGGVILMAAFAFVVIPEGMQVLSLIPIAMWFLAGSIT